MPQRSPPSLWSWSLWTGVTNNIPALNLPQLSQDLHLSINMKGRTSNWLSWLCATCTGPDRTQASVYKFIARHANKVTVKAFYSMHISLQNQIMETLFTYYTILHQYFMHAPLSASKIENINAA